MKPLAILLNGLLVYQPAPLTPLGPLASLLEKNGYEVCITNHFNTGCRGLRAPALIIGHSQGGASALDLAQSYPNAKVITFDAVRMRPCPRHGNCLNFRTVGYPEVPRALNISLDLSFSHISLPLQPSLQQRTLRYAQRQSPVTQRHDASHDRVPDSSHNPQPDRVERTDVQPVETSAGPARSRTSELDAFPNRIGKDPFLFDRWPNEEFEELPLTFEQLCVYITYEGCPK